MGERLPFPASHHMHNLKNHLISGNASIFDALQRLDESSLQIVLVVDEAGRLLGTLTDGDVRRGLLHGIPLDAPVGRIMCHAPKVSHVDASDAEVLAVMKVHRLRHLPIVDASGRVTGLRTLEDLLLTPQFDNPVLLMAGGLGTRLRPLTETTPKPMLQVGGKPLLETILENFVRQGFSRFYISLNYRGEMIQSYFGNGERWGARIEYLEETQRMGTAGCLSLLPERPREPILVMNGDILTSVNFQQMLSFHNEMGAAATMAAFEQKHHIQYGVLEIESHQIVNIVEKPIHHFFINAGIYILAPRVFDLIARDEPLDMPHLFSGLIAKGERTVAFPIREYWLDIGQPHDLERAENEFSQVFT